MQPEATSQVATETEQVVEQPEPASVEDPSKIIAFKVTAKANAKIRGSPSMSEISSANTLLHVLDLCTTPSEMLQQHTFRHAQAHMMGPRITIADSEVGNFDGLTKPTKVQFDITHAIKELEGRSKEKRLHELSLDMELQELETALDWKLRYLRFVKDIMLGTMILGIVFLTASLALEASWRSL